MGCCVSDRPVVGCCVNDRPVVGCCVNNRPVVGCCIPSCNTGLCGGQNLVTSLAANKGRLDSINALAEEIIKDGSSQTDQVRRRKEEINRRWV